MSDSDRSVHPATAEKAFIAETDDAFKLRALELIDANRIRFQAPFRKWINENWHLWKRFEAEAFAVLKSGRTRYSARTIIEFLRHETFVRESSVTAELSPGGVEYKINNSYVPDVSRLFGLLHPSKSDFFECRELTGPSVRVAIRGLALARAPEPATETDTSLESSAA